jgi:hypothetical protein
MKASVLVLIGCAIVALAGCGTAHVAGVGSSATPGARSAVNPGGPIAQTPHQRAVADAASILASFRAPSGAQRTSAFPAALTGAARTWLSKPPQTPGTSDLVTDTEWWRVAGTPQSILNWVGVHLPGGVTRSGNGSGGSVGTGGTNIRQPIKAGLPGAQPIKGRTGIDHPGMWFDVYSRPAMSGTLTQRDLSVAVSTDATGHTIIRVDAEVAWQPAKPATERIPSAATVVTVIPDYGTASLAHPGASPVTVTDPAKVARIAAAVNALQLNSPGVRSCPMETGQALRLTFRASLHGPVLAAVDAQADGCGTVSFTLGSKAEPALANGPSLTHQVLTIIGAHWSI